MKLLKVRWNNPEILLEPDTGTGLVKRESNGSLTVIPYTEFSEEFFNLESIEDLEALLELGDIVSHDTSEFALVDHNHDTVYEPADATILKSADILSSPDNSSNPISAEWAYVTLMKQNYILSGC
mgnify:CR=1 FL=1